MKKNLENNSTDWLSDLELKKILKIDDFKISELILNFDLLAYDIKGNIRHFYEEDASGLTDRCLYELVLEIGSLKFKRKDVDEFIKNYPNFGNSEPGTPASYRWRLENELKNIIYLEKNRKQQGSPPSSHLKKEKRTIREEIKDSKQITSAKIYKVRSRTQVARAIYLSAAARAKTVIQDQIHHDVLPVTRKEKLEVLKTDKQFQKIIASLPKPVSDNHLIRRLNEVSPGLWSLGKSTNKKYRKKSMYSS